jgi:hypothetical protein
VSGILRLGAVPVQTVSFVFVVPWFDFGQLDTASACCSSDPGQLSMGLRQEERTNIAWCNARCDVEFLYDITLAVPLRSETTALETRGKLLAT